MKRIQHIVEHNHEVVYDGPDGDLAKSIYDESVQTDPTVDCTYYNDGAIERDHVGTNWTGCTIKFYDKRHLEIGLLDYTGMLWFAQSGRGSQWRMDALPDGKWPTIKHITLDDHDHELHIYNIGGFNHRDHKKDGPEWAATCNGLSSIYMKSIPHRKYHV